MKHYLNETVAFIADIHTITKIKVRKKRLSVIVNGNPAFLFYFNRVQ
jgi:hypothetical protein